MEACIHCGAAMEEGAFFCPKCLRVQLRFSGDQGVPLGTPPSNPTPSTSPPVGTPVPAIPHHLVINATAPPGALICPTCNNIISAKAVRCPLCGGRLKDRADAASAPH